MFDDPDEFLINILLPDGETDFLVKKSNTLATDLHREIIVRAGGRLEVNDSDVFSKFSCHHYVLNTCTLLHMGMYSGCFVTVEYYDSWTVYVNIPDGATLKVPCNASTTGSDLHQNVVHRASDYFETDASHLYSLFRGKHYGHLDEVSILDIGINDGCHVDVLVRVHGGVCVKNRSGGRKRKVISVSVENVGS